jgi:hypothetical protein
MYSLVMLTMMEVGAQPTFFLADCGFQLFVCAHHFIESMTPKGVQLGSCELDHLHRDILYCPFEVFACGAAVRHVLSVDPSRKLLHWDKQQVFSIGHVPSLETGTRDSFNEGQTHSW